MKKILLVLLFFICLFVSGATLRQRINKQKITLITVQSIEQAKEQAQAIVDQDEQFVKKRLGITKYLIPKNEKLFEVSLAKFSRTFTVLIPKGQKKSFNQFQRKIEFNQSTVFMLDTVDLDKNVDYTTFSVTPNKEFLKKLIEKHNQKFQKPKEDKDQKDKKKNNNNNPFGIR